MRKLIPAIILILLSQLTLWAGSHHIIVELSSSARATSVAAAVGGQIEQSIPGTNFYLMKVPSGTALGPASNLGLIGAQLDNSVSVHPRASFLILEVPASEPA